MARRRGPAAQKLMRSSIGPSHRATFYPGLAHDRFGAGSRGGLEFRPGSCHASPPRKAATREIPPQAIRIAIPGGQCDVAVRPNEIEGAAHNTGSPHFDLPGKK